MTFIGLFASGADESGEECASGRRPSRASTALAVVVGAPLQEAFETPLKGRLSPFVDFLPPPLVRAPGGPQEAFGGHP
jgi:hypothetical protein